MSRKSSAIIREVNSDPKYNSVLITKLINSVMLDGKKGVAQKIVYDAFEMVEKKTKKKPNDIFNKAIDNIGPQLELKGRRVGGSNYQIPIETSERRKKILAIRWLVDFSRKRGEKTMSDRLAKEIIDASNETGASIKKKNDTLKMAEANRAFAHFRW